MIEEIVLDLGEYGEVVVESAGAREEGASRWVSRREVEYTRRKIDADALLRAPLTGLGKLFMASLPQPASGDPYELDEFDVEFKIGLEAQTGTNPGAVVKIMPSGMITCKYRWKRRKSADK